MAPQSSHVHATPVKTNPFVQTKDPLPTLAVHLDDLKNPLIQNTDIDKPRAQRDLPPFDYAHGPGHLH